MSSSEVLPPPELVRSRVVAAGAEGAGAVWRVGYIVNRNADLLWFLTIPFLSLAIAFGCYAWLPAVALASITLWITIPHHFATWVRAYGLAEDRRRWIGPLTVGPILILALTILGLKWAPITVVLVAILWDKQHLLMQQHGLGRIYDFKARTGAKITGRFDLALNWVLFVNLFLTSPFFTPLWLRELYRLHLPLSVEAVRAIHATSWSITLGYLAVYCGHLVWLARRGFGLNPIKYLFLASTYFVWYYTAWHTASALVYAIAGQLMHGIQYIVISYYYTQKRSEQSGERGWAAFLVRKGNVYAFLGMGVLYALIYQLLVSQPLNNFGFGVLYVQQSYDAVDRFGLASLTQSQAYDLFAAALVQVASLVHYYFDSFIWKVSDAKTRAGL
jgi:hypothetical protein